MVVIMVTWQSNQCFAVLGKTWTGSDLPSSVATNSTPVAGAKRTARKGRGIFSASHLTEGSCHVRKRSSYVVADSASVRSVSSWHGVGTMTIPERWWEPGPRTSCTMIGSYTPLACALTMLPAVIYVAYEIAVATTKNHTMRESISLIGAVYRREGVGEGL